MPAAVSTNAVQLFEFQPERTNLILQT